VVLNGLSLSWGPLSLSATLPVIAQSGEGVAFLGGGMMPTGGAVHEGLTEASPDLTVFLGWSFGVIGARPVENRNPGMDGHS
jgi:hypothetical protein